MFHNNIPATDPVNTNHHRPCKPAGLTTRRNSMSAEIESALDQIRPALKADGGNVELVEVSADGVVKVKLTGACGHCPMSAQTLKFGVERTLKEKVPGVTAVVAV
jgi:Fe-S cluster biogenesis protein NfuA